MFFSPPQPIGHSDLGGSHIEKFALFQSDEGFDDLGIYGPTDGKL